MTLTPKQSGYAACVLDGLEARKAARAMGHRYNTARTHYQRLRERFGARSMQELAQILKGIA